MQALKAHRESLIAKEREKPPPEQMRLTLDMQGLMIGADLTVEKVKASICPECPFKTPFCQWLLEKVWLPGSNVGFICKGMRAWIIQSN